MYIDKFKSNQNKFEIYIYLKKHVALNFQALINLNELLNLCIIMLLLNLCTIMLLSMQCCI